MGSYKKFSHKSSMFVNTVGLICSLTKTKWLYMISVKFGPMVQKLCQVYCIIFLLLRRVAIRYIFHLFIPLNTGITNWKYQMSKLSDTTFRIQSKSVKNVHFFFFLNGKYKVQL